MSETAHDDDVQHHADEELAAVAAQVQALEEFQARAMAGLQRLHEMKSEERTDAVELGGLQISVADPSPAIASDEVAMLAGPIHNQEVDACAGDLGKSSPSNRERAQQDMQREVIEEEPVDEASVDELLALQAQAQAMVEAMEKLQTSLDDTATDSRHTTTTPGDVDTVTLATIDDGLVSSIPSVAPTDSSTCVPKASRSSDIALNHGLTVPETHGVRTLPVSVATDRTSVTVAEETKDEAAQPLPVVANTNGKGCNDAFHRFTTKKSDLDSIDAAIAASIGALAKYATLAQAQQHKAPS